MNRVLGMDRCSVLGMVGTDVFVPCKICMKPGKKKGGVRSVEFEESSTCCK